MIRPATARIWIIALLLACPCQALGGAPEQLRMAIVLDDSGSMRREDRDPRRLSVTAAMIAVQLSGPADRVALVPLNGRATRLMAGGSNAALLRTLRNLQRRGAETIYDRPLRHAIKLLGTTGKRMVLFLTDGEPEPRGKGDKEKVQRAHDLFLKELAAKPPRGVTFFPVVLGQVDPHWTGLLKKVAEATGGQLFSVQRAEGLIEVFADIYARMISSKRVLKELRGTGGPIVSIDDFVRFANLVIVPDDDRPFSVAYPTRRGGGAAVDNGTDRGKAAARVFHYVDKIDVTQLSPGSQLSVKLSGSARTYRALLIYDYDLQLHLAPPQARLDGGYPLQAYLTRRSDGARVSKRAFLGGVKVKARLCRPPCDPGRRLGCADRIGLELHPDKPAFTGLFTPPVPGTYCVDARARRVWQGQQTLDLLSREVHQIHVPGGSRLTCSAKRLHFAMDQNKGGERWRSCQRLALGGRNLARPVKVKLAAPGLKLPEGSRLEVEGATDNTVTLRPGAPQNVNVCLVSDELVDRPGIDIKSTTLQFASPDKQWFSEGGHHVQVPADLKITARSWWNRYKCLLLFLAIALAVLLFLIWLIYGFIKPHRFPDNLKVNWGKSIKRLDRNEMPVSEVHRSGRGFYRNAQLWIGGRRCFMESGLPATARFEATSRRGISVFAEEGATVERINKFDTEKLESVTSGTHASLGDIYKINDLYFRLKI